MMHEGGRAANNGKPTCTASLYFGQIKGLLKK